MRGPPSVVVYTHVAGGHNQSNVDKEVFVSSPATQQMQQYKQVQDNADANAGAMAQERVGPAPQRACSTETGNRKQPAGQVRERTSSKWVAWPMSVM